MTNQLEEAKIQAKELNMVVNTGIGGSPEWDEQKCVELFKWTIAEVERLRSEEWIKETLKKAVVNFIDSEIDKCDLQEKIESLTKERDELKDRIREMEWDSNEIQEKLKEQ